MPHSSRQKIQGIREQLLNLDVPLSLSLLSDFLNKVEKLNYGFKNHLYLLLVLQPVNKRIEGVKSNRVNSISESAMNRLHFRKNAQN